MALPERTCIVCKRSAAKSQLLRFIWADSKVVWDRHQILKGRGGYVHPNWSCLSRVSETKNWQRCFRLESEEVARECFQNAMKEVRKYVLASADEKVDDFKLPNKKKIRI